MYGCVRICMSIVLLHLCRCTMPLMHNQISFFFFFKGKFSISALPNLIRPSFFILFFSTNNNLYRMSHLKRNNRAGLDKTRKYGSIKWTAR